MTSIKRFIMEHPSVKEQVSMAEICQTLNKLGIIYFGHAHIDQNNQLLGLSSCPLFFDLYMQQGFYQYDLHMAGLPEGKHYIIWDALTRKKQSATLHELFSGFGRNHTFTIAHINQYTKDYYHFATKTGQTNMNGRYILLLDELYAFINMFHDKVNQHKALKKAYEMNINLNVETGDYLTTEPLHHTQIYTEHFKQDKYYLNHILYLTKRELSCIYWLVQGKSIVETAIILGITERTVKQHIHHVKTKMGCHTLFQLGVLCSQYLDRNLLRPE